MSIDSKALVSENHSLTLSRKVKVAFLFGYVGTGYYGLQYGENASYPTIERVIIEALYVTGMVDRVVAEAHEGGVLQYTQWQRASRTDKGVHALINVASAKIRLPLQANPTSDDESMVCADCVKRLNAQLPPAIRIFDVRLVTVSFNSYVMCVSRKYEYHLPTYAVLSPEEFNRLFPIEIAPWEGDTSHNSEGYTDDVDNEVDDNDDAPEAKKRRVEEPHRSGRDVPRPFRSIPTDLKERLRSHRIGEKPLALLRRLLEVLEGTHRFHNFTVSRSSGDPSVHRHIRQIKVSDPSVGVDGVETVVVELWGDSFMLHQIRKMIGAVLCVMALRPRLDETETRSIFSTNSDEAVGTQEVDWLRNLLNRDVLFGAPMAPANGLLLIALSFDTYNIRLQRIQSQGANASGRRVIDTESLDQESVSLMRKQITAQIAAVEYDECTLGVFMRNLRHITQLTLRTSNNRLEKAQRQADLSSGIHPPPPSVTHPLPTPT